MAASSLSRRGLLRLAAVAGLALPAAACGYRPVYRGGARNSPVAQDLAKVRVALIPERIGQILRNELEQEIAAAGRNQPKVYTLDVRPVLTSSSLGIEKDATATRARLMLESPYWLLGPDQAVLFSGRVTSVASYNILDDQYATVISREDAEKRVARDTAERILSRLSVHFVGEEAGG